jgi:hypothetical protein
MHPSVDPEGRFSLEPVTAFRTETVDKTLLAHVRKTVQNEHNATCLMNRKQLVAKSSSSLIHTNCNGRICLELVKLLKLSGVVLMISNISVVVCLRYLYLHLPSFRRDKTTKMKLTLVTVFKQNRLGGPLNGTIFSQMRRNVTA